MIQNQRRRQVHNVVPGSHQGDKLSGFQEKKENSPPVSYQMSSFWFKNLKCYGEIPTNFMKDEFQNI